MTQQRIIADHIREIVIKICSNRIIETLMIVLVSLSFESVVLAELEEVRNLDLIVEHYRDASAVWTNVLRRYAYGLFWSLAVIEMAWTGISLLIAQADIGEILSEVVRRVLYLGFFFALLDNSNTWCSCIIGSFRAAGNAASQASGGTANISPSSIFDIGLELASRITDDVSILAPGDSFGLILSSIIILVCFALISALLLLALVEMYIVLNAGIIFLGFGGCRYTQDYALKHINYTVSVGGKIFVMQLLIGIGESFILDWRTSFYSNNNVQILVLIGTSIVMLVLVKTIPNIVQSLLTGVSYADFSSLSSVSNQVMGTSLAVSSGLSKTIKEAGSHGCSVGKSDFSSRLQPKSESFPASTAMCREKELAGQFAQYPGVGISRQPGAMHSSSISNSLTSGNGEILHDKESDRGRKTTRSFKPKSDNQIMNTIQKGYI